MQLQLWQGNPPLVAPLQAALLQLKASPLQPQPGTHAWHRTALHTTHPHDGGPALSAFVVRRGALAIVEEARRVAQLMARCLPNVL